MHRFWTACGTARRGCVLLMTQTMADGKLTGHMQHNAGTAQSMLDWSSSPAWHAPAAAHGCCASSLPHHHHFPALQGWPLGS